MHTEDGIARLQMGNQLAVPGNGFRYAAMNVLQPPNAFFFACLVIYIAIRHVYIGRAKTVKTSVARIDATEKILLGLMVPAVIVFPVLYLFTPTLSFADYQLHTVVRWTGAGILIASLCLFWRSHVDLANNWSPSLEIRENHGLVATGVYRTVRHPMYASIWLWALAQGMMLQNWLAGWFMLPAFAAMYFIRIPREEQMMLEKFGNEYLEYSNRTGRLIPRLGNAT